MIREAWRRAVKGCRKPVYQGGQLVGYVREFSDLLLIFLIKAARPHAELLTDEERVRRIQALFDLARARKAKLLHQTGKGTAEPQ
jgi:hypothetical protein